MLPGLAGIGGQSITAAAAASDPNFANVKLLCGFEGADGGTTFVDESATGRALTRFGTPEIDTAQFKYGSSSCLFDGFGDDIRANDSADWDLGTNPFTMEMFWRPSSLAGDGANQTFLSQWSGTTAWAFYYESGVFKFLFTDTGGVNREVTVATAFSANTWYHIAIDRDGSNKYRLFKDGVMVASATITQTPRAGNGTLWIGGLDGFNQYSVMGWLDEVRMTMGVSRYGSDSNFTPPTAAFPRS